MRRVFVNSIVLNEHTTLCVLFMFDTTNRSGLTSLTIHGNVDWPKDMAVRHSKTLHRLISTGTEQLRKVMRSVREWESMGGSLQELTLRKCDAKEEVDIGSCDSLIALHIQDCSSSLSTTPVGSLRCTRLLWGILHKCKNLKRFTNQRTDGVGTAMSGRNLCLLARLCPHLESLRIDATADPVNAAFHSVIGTCTEIQHLCLHLRSLGDSALLVVSATLVSLRSLTIANLELINGQPLRCLAHCCPHLRQLTITKGNGDVNETELLYLVQHGKNLQRLTIGKWDHLTFQDIWWELEPSKPQILQHLGIEDPAALISAEQERMDKMIAATEQPGEMDTLQKLRAARNNPGFKVVLLDE